MKKADIYQTITDQILASLTQGIIPWQKPFQSSFSPIPVNFSTSKAYRGINLFLLNLTAWQLGYPQNSWLTFKQAKALGGHVKKGETAQTVVFWKTYTVQEENAQGELQARSAFVARAYSVFNLQQCEGLETDTAVPSQVPQLGSAAAVYQNYPGVKPEILPSTKAFYLPHTDQVHIPDVSDFISPSAYYATLFHELIHSTGHTTRLNREGITQATRSDQVRYAQEELVAEMGAAFLSALTGIETPALSTNATAYLQSWLEVLQQDNRMIVKAASQAQKAVDFIIGRLE